MLDYTQIEQLLPKGVSKMREVPADNTLALYLKQDTFEKRDWKPLREYLRSVNWDIIFVLI